MKTKMTTKRQRIEHTFQPPFRGVTLFSMGEGYLSAALQKSKLERAEQLLMLLVGLTTNNN